MNMAAKRTHKHLGLAMAAWIAASGLMASEYHGVVRSGGLPFPGVTVTAIREGKKIVTTTNEQGAFSFADLADGVWAIQVETFGFERIVREVGVASGAPAGVWELQYQSQEAILAGLRPAPEAPAMEPGPRPEDAPGRNPASACGRTGGDETQARGSQQDADRMGMTDQTSQDSAGGGRGGPGGSSGSGGGGRGGAGGGPGGGPGGGGPGGGGPGGGGPGDPGGPEGGRGGPPGGRPDWQGRPNAMALGNGRRDPRNMYNGNLSFSLGNSALDARSYSVTGASVAKPAYANGRGDVTFGGPLRIPKLVSPQQHIMFTLSYQFQRNRTGTISQPVNMPQTWSGLAIFRRPCPEGRRSRSTTRRRESLSPKTRSRPRASARPRRPC